MDHRSGRPGTSIVSRGIVTFGVTFGLVATSLSITSCDPYGDYRDGNTSLGPVDPVNFPAASLGASGNRAAAGRGRFVEVKASADGMTIGYFAYPFPGRVPADPLRLSEDAKPTTKAPLSAAQGAAYAPNAYSFEGCDPPPGYQHDLGRDEFSEAEQGVIFGELPEATYAPGTASATNYLPVVTEIVKGGRQRCQAYKAVKQVMTKDERPSGRYMAWALIDPATGVYRFDSMPTNPAELDGLGLQKWGWFNRYLVAYLDGGEVPQMTSTDMMGKAIVRMRPQRLVYPRTMIPMGNMGKTEPGRIGAGYDILEARRSDADYSPVCEVFTYARDMAPMPPPGMMAPAPTFPTAIDQLSPTELASLMPATTRYTFCLQVR